ncbi:TlpA family protein disulfide reductase [Solitalea sp. MAHUQ-68]|uniref:TlpA family protein disulfide reductase n=1 Tax=Solitalea agri TaxID=2953739 RepID=A0A9X2EZ59_9SPHI|nr:TlpA disulfide reductase family protein [Solitalea agri]MCO4291719.1 TlpA family protein disulfide reductase [Solitalea agri]
MKKQYLLILLSLGLLLPIAVFAQDSITISGKIKNVEKYLIENNSIKFFKQDIVFDEQLVYNVLIQPDGSFTIKLPIDIPQDIFFIFKERPIGLLVSPGEKLVISMDADDISHSLEFTGGEAKTNSVLNIFLNQYLDSKEVNNKSINDILTSYQRDSSATAFKNYRYSLLKEDINLLNSFVKKNKTTDLFKRWATYFIEYQCADDLMRYDWIHQPMFSLEADYFDFFDRFSLNNPDATISSLVYGKYIHEYNNYIKSRRTYHSFPIDSLIESVISYDTNITDEEKSVLHNFNKQPNGSADYAGNDTLILKKVLERNSELLKTLNDFDYIASKSEGYLRNILFANYVYKNIKNKHSAITSQITVFQKLVSDEKIKQKVMTEYQRELDKINSFKLPAQANNTTTSANSADSTFQKIIEKYKGKVIYVDFWATWCGPCKAEMPKSKKLHDELKGKDVVFLYLGVQSEENVWKSNIAELKIEGEHYLLNNNDYNALAARFQISGIPHYVLLDKQGRVREDDAKSPSETELKDEIIALLNENL